MRTSKPLLAAALVAALLCLTWAGHTQTTSVTSAIFGQLFVAQSAVAQSPVFVNVQGLGVTNHVFQWSVTGAPAGCTLLIQSSLDAVTRSTIGTQTCTSASTVTVTGTYIYLTVELSVFAGGSSPTISVNYRGFYPGQAYPQLTGEGGTGTTTTFTQGSMVFAGASGVYSQDNSNLFWDDGSNRLCLLANACSNTLDIGGAKFYVTSAGLWSGYEGTVRATSAAVIPLSVQGAAAQSGDLQRWKNSAGATLASVTSAGVITPSAGMAYTGKNKFPIIPIGSVAYGSLGTNTTPVAGTLYYADLWLPFNKTLTGVGILNGGTVGTDSWIVGIHASAGGAVLANSALAGTVSAGANAFQQIAFTSSYAAVGPARYWIVLQSNGTTDRFRSVAVSTYIDVLTKSSAGAFGTLSSLTVPTTFTADVGPVAYVY